MQEVKSHQSSLNLVTKLTRNATPFPEKHHASESDFFLSTVKSNLDQAKLKAELRCGVNDSIDLQNAGMDEDECNLINKEDFEEHKQKDKIVTARATPIKANALAKKNLSTARKMTH